MELLLISFFAGILTVLSPCVLPLLPIIIGGSIKDQSKKRPILITLSLAISIITFTLLLKTTTLLINVPPYVIQYSSGGLVIFFGLITLFPTIWEKISIKLNLQKSSDELLNKSSKKKGDLGSILIGASLGPVFASCSPTYAVIIATVLPADFGTGLINLISYALGLSLLMLLISIFGQRIIKKVKWAANPNGLFRRGLGVLFIIVGIILVLGLNTRIQTYLAQFDFLNTSKLEQSILQNNKTISGSDGVVDSYKAPELIGLDNWINSNPQTLESLKGKVVIIDFWTYSCINCIRTIPTLNSWYSTYEKDGLVIIGVHAPEFQFEKKKENVQKAITDYSIKYPVALDNDFKTWNAYNNKFWPAKYFIDRDGNVRYTHFGEGGYEESEKVIRELLLEGGNKISSEKTSERKDDLYREDQTPETYLGYGRADRSKFLNEKDNIHDEDYKYNLAPNLNLNQWSIGSNWLLEEQGLTSNSNESTLKIHFSAKEVYLVAGAQNGGTIKITLNGKELEADQKGIDVNQNSSINIQDEKLYRIIKLNEFKKDQLLELKFSKDVRANVFTFGS